MGEVTGAVKLNRIYKNETAELCSLILLYLLIVNIGELHIICYYLQALIFIHFCATKFTQNSGHIAL